MVTEDLMHVPAHDNMTEVSEYDTRLHNQSVHIFNPMAIDARVTQLKLKPRVAHIVLVADQSSALNDTFRGLDKRYYAREVIRRFVKTMPDQAFSSTIITYNDSPTLQLYAPLDARLSIKPHYPHQLVQSLGDYRASQHIEVQSLSLALDFVSELVGNLPGPSAVVLVTDWAQIDESVENAVMRMRQRVTFNANAHVVVPNSTSVAWPKSYSGLCFYTIGVGNKMSRSRLESADSCGFSYAVDKIAQPSNMANFVETVLYKGPSDSDNDGIYDYQDRCPSTRPDKLVDYSGCPRFPSHY
ncbi:hypothetical protein N9V74_06145 [Alteromonas sp.]|nr:hypothetical protein [Alteromonas sp.]